MQNSLSITNVLKKKVTELFSAENWITVLKEKGLKEFEEIFFHRVLKLYDQLCDWIINECSKSKDFENRQRKWAAKNGLKKLVIRESSLQLRTGTKVKYDSLYAKIVPEDYKGARHISHKIWHSEAGASPIYKSLSCLLSVLCPSFEVGKVVLRHQGVQANADRIRKLSLSLASKAMENRVGIQLEAQETMEGKRVLISIDGGEREQRFIKKKNHRNENKGLTRLGENQRCS